jgi:hypothetical protein
MAQKQKRDTGKLQRAGRAFLADMEKARARVGTTAESKLKWLLQFKDKDLNRLTRGERIPFGHGLRCLPDSSMIHGGKASRTVSFSLSNLEMPDEMIFELQEWVREFLAALGGSGDYEYQSPEKIRIHRMNPANSNRMAFQVMPLFPFGDERLAVKYAAVNIVLDASDKLRLCLQCNAPFAAHRKQAYCRPQCSQRKRDIKRGRSYADKK